MYLAIACFLYLTILCACIRIFYLIIPIHLFRRLGASTRNLRWHTYGIDTDESSSNSRPSHRIYLHLLQHGAIKDWHPAYRWQADRWQFVIFFGSFRSRYVGEFPVGRSTVLLAQNRPQPSSSQMSCHEQGTPSSRRIDGIYSATRFPIQSSTWNTTKPKQTNLNQNATKTYEKPSSKNSSVAIRQRSALSFF